MKGDKSKFIELQAKVREHVTYGNNNRCEILGIGIMGNPSRTIIEDVFLLLLRVLNTTCDTNNQCVFKGIRVYNVFFLDLG